MKSGILKIGDTVKFNARAMRELESVIDEDTHIVKRIDGEIVTFDNLDFANIFWLKRVKSALTVKNSHQL